MPLRVKNSKTAAGSESSKKPVFVQAPLDLAATGIGIYKALINHIKTEDINKSPLF